MVDGSYYCSITLKLGESGSSMKHNGIMKLYWQDGQLKGSIFPTIFWRNTSFRGGTVDGNKFSFTALFATPCQQYSAEVQGEVNGDNVTGTYTNVMGTYILEGTRVKD